MAQTFGDNQQLVEQQYRLYAGDPASVDAQWRAFFAELSADVLADLGKAAGGRNGTARPAAPSAGDQQTQMRAAANLARLTERYRLQGHYAAQLDPLRLSQPGNQQLDPAANGLLPEHMDVTVPTDIPGLPLATVRDAIAHLQRTYCGNVGFEYSYIEDPAERQWLLERIEGDFGAEVFESANRRKVLEHLTDAQELEHFLHTHYVGAKRFSLEGLEPLIPMLHRMLDLAGGVGVQDTIIGMAHRGRLNVLVNILGKRLEDLFTAFNDPDSSSLIGRGDVKYHLGYSTTRQVGRHEMNVALCFNPSHLEFVDPVVNGRARAIADRRQDTRGSTVLSISIHGDAALAGQGIVMETLNLAQLEGYKCGGTVHVVLNNQVGFTTSPGDARSCRHASDIVRYMRVPVFHVNAEDLDAVMRVTQLAIDYRQTFQRDVCIDLVGYRRYGHNEGDEPRFTQPEMYKAIDARDTTRELFAQTLVSAGVLSPAEAAQMVDTRRARMLDALQSARQVETNPLPRLSDAVWARYQGGAFDGVPAVATAVPEDRIRSLVTQLCTMPAGFQPHPKVERVYQQRATALEAPGGIDWGMGEMLAFATLLNDGTPIRLSGQDCRRGTFSHRHAALVDHQTGTRHIPLSTVTTSPSYFQVYDSPLSEAAVLGFDYGYSLEAPDALVIWEAQFGDFVNGAQVIIDQFIASGEDKWNRLTGLTMLLPHGFEGQGPEHSYARLGRFLQLCAEDNLIVADCTTPAQLFHLLRRQALGVWRKPLVVMSPKSLLRHKRCVSSLEDLTSGTFQTILADTSATPPAGVRRVLLCSGRLYYDLEAAREQRGAKDVHVLRLEQLYPLDVPRLTQLLSAYGPGTELVWVQDEPWNLGAWTFVQSRLLALFGDGLPLRCVARAESASPATGSGAAHRAEASRLIEAAFT